MANNVNWDVAIVDGAVQVTDRASGSIVSPSANVNEFFEDTITIWPESGMTIDEVSITDTSWTNPTSSYPPPGPYTLEDGNDDVLSITYNSNPNNVVIEDLDSSQTSSYEYKLGLTVAQGGTQYSWDPTVHEKPPGG